MVVSMAACVFTGCGKGQSKNSEKVAEVEATVEPTPTPFVQQLRDTFMYQGEQIKKVNKKEATPIKTVEDLYLIKSNPSGNFVLMADLDMSESNRELSIGRFSGCLDGNYHKIENLHGTFLKVSLEAL